MSFRSPANNSSTIHSTYSGITPQVALRGVRGTKPRPTSLAVNTRSGACAKAHTRPIDRRANGRQQSPLTPHSRAGCWGLQSPASNSPVIDRGIFLAPAALGAVAHLIPNVLPFFTPLKRSATDWTSFCSAITRACPRSNADLARALSTHLKLKASSASTSQS